MDKNMLCLITSESIAQLQPHERFVFGSNLMGIHGAGAALFAFKNFNAKWGVGYGFTGQCFALPTKDRQIKTLPLPEIQKYVNGLLDSISHHPDIHFLITKVGCGYAGYQPKQIAFLFKEFLSLKNCSLPIEFINAVS